MAKPLTLADFARFLQISPELARQWKRRGKITETDDCFIYSDGENGATLSKIPALSVPAEPQDVVRLRSVTADAIAVTHDNKMQPPLTLSGVLNAKCESVTIKTCGDPECNACRSLTEQSDSVTVVSQWEDVPQPDSVTTVAADIDIERDIVVNMLPKSVTRGVVVTWDMFNFLLKRVHDLQDRVAALERESKRARADVGTLYGDSAEYNKRLEALEGDPVARSRAQFYKADAELERAIEELDKPQLGKPKNGVIDPPGPNWGA